MRPMMTNPIDGPEPSFKKYKNEDITSDQPNWFIKNDQDWMYWCDDESEADTLCFYINNFDAAVEALKLARNVIESRGKLLNITPDIVLNEIDDLLVRIDAEGKQTKGE